MAILKPEHLLEQASKLIQLPQAGRPRQVDLRRAISAAYYAIFHAVITVVADELLGVGQRQTREYGLIVRAVDHGAIRTICVDLVKSTPPTKYLIYLPAGGLRAAAQAFLTTFPGLQEERHSADYDVLRAYRTSDAKSVVAIAQSALAQLRAVPADERRLLSFLLLFPPRR